MNRDERAKLLADTIACLLSYGIQHAGQMRGSPIVADHWPHTAYNYTVCDNGGEFHVHRINSFSPGGSVPYETTRGDMDPGTMAYRVQCVMRGERIDWSLRFSAEEIEIMKEAA